MKSDRNRLDALEENLLRQLGSDDDRRNWAELQQLFTADTDNAALLATLAHAAGHRSLRHLLRIESDDANISPLVGRLRGAVGQFCRVHGIRCPESDVILVRAMPGQPDRSVIVPSLSGRFTQMVEVPATIRRIEVQHER